MEEIEYKRESLRKIICSESEVGDNKYYGILVSGDWYCQNRGKG